MDLLVQRMRLNSNLTRIYSAHPQLRCGERWGEEQVLQATAPGHHWRHRSHHRIYSIHLCHHECFDRRLGLCEGSGASHHLDFHGHRFLHIRGSHSRGACFTVSIVFQNVYGRSHRRLNRPPRIWFYQNFSPLFGLALLPLFWWATMFLLFMPLWQEVYGWSPVGSACRM
jgi:hypothetical protein